MRTIIIHGLALAGGLRRFPAIKEGAESMSENEQVKEEIKKLSARATQAKMNLHGLSEELPQA